MNQEQLFLKDLAQILLQRALEAKREAAAQPKSEFHSGRSLAFYEVISIFKHQFEIFQMPSYGLEEIDPDKDLA